MRILGVDPGVSITGYGLIQIENKFHYLTTEIYGEIINSRNKIFSHKILKIHTMIFDIINNYKPHAVVIENIFYGKNIQSLIKQGHVKGVIVLAAAQCDIPLYEYAPTEIKQSVVGNGHAHKKEIQNMIKLIFNLSEYPSLDASDALATALCHINFLKKEKKFYNFMINFILYILCFL